jgi:hypothetical protein
MICIFYLNSLCSFRKQIKEEIVSIIQNFLFSYVNHIIKLLLKESIDSYPN